MINTDDNEKIWEKTWYIFIKNTLIEFYEASKVSSLISYFRNLSFITQIHILFITFISIYCFVNSYYRFNYYQEIFTPQKNIDIYYNFMIDKLLKKEKDFIIHW